jgi:cytoskeleton protein RodZ
MAEEAPPQERPDFSFGDELRKEREIRGISLNEIADATKISKRFLESIERNDFATLPAPVFTRGFVREYARYLGLNAEEMVDRYAMFARQSESPNDPQPQPLSSSAAGSESAPAAGGVNRVLLISAAVVVPLLIVAGILLWRGGFFGAPEPAATTTPMDAVETVSTQPIEPSPTVVPSPAGSPLSLMLETTGDVWLVAEADGKQVISENLRMGERRTVGANEKIELKQVGNAGGLKLTLNGTPLPPLGGAGDVVRNRVFDLSSVATAGTLSSPQP